MTYWKRYFLENWHKIFQPNFNTNSEKAGSDPTGELHKPAAGKEKSTGS